MMEISSQEKVWYAIYTKPRSEKKVYQRLVEQGIEAFLPLQKRLKQWSDRKKWVEEPLFHSYLFVHIASGDYYNVLNTIGVVRYITFNGKAAPIPTRQIEQVREILNQDIEIETVTKAIRPGDRVEVKFGLLKGIIGELVEISGHKKLIIRIDHISHQLQVTLPPHFIIRSL